MSAHGLAVPVLLVLVLAFLPAVTPSLQSQDAPLEPLIVKLGDYVASYGAKASILVGVEKYTQSVTLEGRAPVRPRQLVAEFAIVKADEGWVGYRDVVQVNNQPLRERRDRLLTLFTAPSADASQVIRIANESARYNYAPVETNLNVPTTTLFFFQPANLHRFAFTRKGMKKIDGVETVEFAFRETVVPTLVMRRSGANVPLEGTLWIIPSDGVVVRSWLRLRGFADTVTTKVQGPPAARPPVNPNTATGGGATPGFQDPIDAQEIKSAADIEVTYARHAETGLWLPARMSEHYEGAIKLDTRPPRRGLSTTRASYSDYKQFGTRARIAIPKAP